MQHSPNHSLPAWGLGLPPKAAKEALFPALVPKKSGWSRSEPLPDVMLLIEARSSSRELRIRVPTSFCSPF